MWGRRLTVALVLGCAVAGCGGAAAEENGEVTITVTSRGYPEEKVLREIYAHALETAGFEVRRRDPRLLPSEELEKGRVSGYPEHLDAALVEITSADLEAVPGPAKAAYTEAKRQLAPKSLVPLPPTSFGRAKVVGVSRTTAEEGDIQTLSDLKGPSGAMSAAGGEYFCFCHGPACLSALERTYGIVFGGFSLAEPASRLRKALREGEADAAVFFATDGRLARGEDWLVLLEDDQHRLPASNAFWLTSQDVIDEAGPDYEKAIVAAQKGLTLKVMRELDAEVELEGKAPGEVAAEYLKSIHFRA